MPKHITPREAVEKLKLNQKVLLLDVRTPQEFEAAHIKNAILLPLQNLSQESLEAQGLGNSARDKEIIIYCRTGSRSLAAYSFLLQLGYMHIKNLIGGIVSWTDEEFIVR